jgi:hypothetical protein
MMLISRRNYGYYTMTEYEDQVGPNLRASVGLKLKYRSKIEGSSGLNRVKCQHYSERRPTESSERSGVFNLTEKRTG